MTFFITGATGFIGSLIVRRLLNEGHRVVALIRPQSRHKISQYHDNLQWVDGDLLDPGSLVEGMRNCDAVFHIAAYASVWAPDDRKFFEINRDGTRHILDAAVKNGIEKLVFTSTAATLPPADPDHPATEDTPKSHFHNPYEKSKYQAEQDVRRYSQTHDLHGVIVNPTRVYGPGPITESNAVTRLIKLYIEGRWHFRLGSGKYIGNYSYVHDIVEGHLLAMRHGNAGNRYLLGGFNLSYNELFEQIGQAAGQKRLLVPLPEFVMKAFARLEESRGRFMGGQPLITPEWMNKYLKNWAVSSEKARKELGYSVTPLQEGLKETIRWLRQEYQIK